MYAMDSTAMEYMDNVDWLISANGKFVIVIQFNSFKEHSKINYDNQYAFKVL